MHPVPITTTQLVGIWNWVFLDCECHQTLPDPVCSTDGIAYDNRCKAECAGAEVQCKGKCPCGNYVINYSL